MWFQMGFAQEHQVQVVAQVHQEHQVQAEQVVHQEHQVQVVLQEPAVAQEHQVQVVQVVKVLLLHVGNGEHPHHQIVVKPIQTMVL